MSDFMFANEDSTVGEEQTPTASNWQLLIVDDEEEVHIVTKLALRDVVYQYRGITFISAYSGQQAKEILDQPNDIALVLLDVVMETDDAGLRVARYIREELNNQLVRIVLRTGQPGQAPERQVIVEYDINDYKSKTELTAQRLFTTIIASFRSYRDLLAIERNRTGLIRVIEASSTLFSFRSMDTFTQGLLQQLSSVFSRGNRAFVLNSLIAETHGVKTVDDSLRIVAGQGRFSGSVGYTVWDVLPPELKLHYSQANRDENLVYGDGYIFYYHKNLERLSALVFISGLPEDISEDDNNLIELFSRNVQIAYDNIILNQEIEDTQREIVYRLGHALETRSKETGNHLKRVADMSELLATLYGVSKNEARLLKFAAPLHDVGKISIPDSVLNYPGKLDAEQWVEMKTHAQKGHDLLADSKREVLQIGAKIALTHHERWDGKGYPNGLKGKDIDFFGRIVSLVDVFDALHSRRCYKPAYDLDFCLNHIKENSNKAFDPELVNIFLENKGRFLKIMRRFPD
ncbi:MAG: DUF3369 domain-containing protein [Gammaproteobacteria bacterium]|nr:DUF3369 domain-containing protein [Gammaproteobacteria bacterium]